LCFNFKGDELVSDEELRKIARESAKSKVEFYTHLVIYIAVNALIIAIWFVTTGLGSFPWFVFPLFGWGIGLAANYVEAFRGKAYTERLAEKEYQKLKEKHQ
jgi:cytochrome b561